MKQYHHFDYKYYCIDIDEPFDRGSSLKMLFFLSFSSLSPTLSGLRPPSRRGNASRSSQAPEMETGQTLSFTIGLWHVAVVRNGWVKVRLLRKVSRSSNETM